MTHLRPEGLKIAALIAPRTDRPGRGQDVGRDACSCEIPTQVLELVLSIARTHFTEMIADDAGDLDRRLALDV
jgi:hypothetical protein